MKKMILAMISLVAITLFSACEEDSPNPFQEESSNETKLRITNQSGESWISFIAPGVATGINDTEYKLTVGPCRFVFYDEIFADGDTTRYKTVTDSAFSVTTAHEQCSFSYYPAYDDGGSMSYRKYSSNETIDLPITVNCEKGKSYTLVIRSYTDMELIED